MDAGIRWFSGRALSSGVELLVTWAVWAELLGVLQSCRYGIWVVLRLGTGA